MESLHTQFITYVCMYSNWDQTCYPGSENLNEKYVVAIRRSTAVLVMKSRLQNTPIGHGNTTTSWGSFKYLHCCEYPEGSENNSYDEFTESLLNVMESSGLVLQLAAVTDPTEDDI